MFVLLQEEMWKSAQNSSGTGDGEKRQEQKDEATGKAAYRDNLEFSNMGNKHQKTSSKNNGDI